MTISVSEVDAALKGALAAISAAKDLDELKAVKIEHVGDKSPIAKLNQSLGKLEAAERAEFGKVLGQAKASIGAAFASQQEKLEIERDARVLLEEVVDVTLPANNSHKGGLHALTVI